VPTSVTRAEIAQEQARLAGLYPEMIGAEDARREILSWVRRVDYFDGFPGVAAEVDGQVVVVGSFDDPPATARKLLELAEQAGEAGIRYIVPTDADVMLRHFLWYSGRYEFAVDAEDGEGPLTRLRLVVTGRAEGPMVFQSPGLNTRAPRPEVTHEVTSRHVTMVQDGVVRLSDRDRV